jgi:hypothetical protein
MKTLLVSEVRTVFTFLNDLLVKKFSILKEGQQLIQSLPPMPSTPA